MHLKPKQINLIVVRHGETHANEIGALQGQTNAPLCEAGIEQVKLAAKALEDTTIDSAYSSDLDRAVQTAELILTQNRSWYLNLQLIQDKLIREKSFGDMENINVKEYSRITKEKGFADEYEFTPEGGESPQQVRERVKKFMIELYERRDKKDSIEPWNVLVVSHAGWIRELTGYLIDELKCEGVPTNAFNEFGHPPFCANTGISKYEIRLPMEEDVDWMWNGPGLSSTCLLFQDISHLNSVPKSQALIEGI